MIEDRLKTVKVLKKEAMKHREMYINNLLDSAYFTVGTATGLIPLSNAVILPYYKAVRKQSSMLQILRSPFEGFWLGLNQGAREAYNYTRFAKKNYQEYQRYKRLIKETE